MSRYDRYTDGARAVLRSAALAAVTDGVEECGLNHLGVGVLMMPAGPADGVWAQTGVKPLDKTVAIWRERINAVQAQPEVATSRTKLSQPLRKVLDAAEASAGSGPVSASHLLAAFWPVAREALAPFFPGPGDLERILAVEVSAPCPVAAPAPGSRPAPISGQAKTAELPWFARDLTAEPAPFPVIGRDREIEELIGVLLKRFKPNPLLIGEAGIGKTAIVEGLAQRIREGRVPEPLRGARIIDVRVSDLRAGASVHGDFEKRIKDLVGLCEADPKSIVFIDEIHQIESPDRVTNVGEILKPALARGKFRCIGATTHQDYQRSIAANDALARRFHMVNVDEPTRESTCIILKALREGLEKHYGLAIPERVLEKAVGLAQERMPHRRFPDKAIDLVDRACSSAVLAGCQEVAEEHVRQGLARLIGVDSVEDDAAFAARLDRLEDKLREKVYGQDEAIRAIANAVRLCKRRMDLRPYRPDGVFLLTGPTGVGKTALAEALAVAVTGRPEGLIRLDMSEFALEHSIARLVGAPPSYVGYGDPPRFLTELRQKPYGVLLLDEFEKAHPEIHRFFLQVFDSGRLSSARGEAYDLSSITIIATANITGAAHAALGFGASVVPRQEAVDHDALSRCFPPELINRFDEILFLRPINRETARNILEDRILTEAIRQVQETTGRTLVVDEGVMERILNEGFSFEYGARHLQRAFERMVMRPLASQMEGLLAGHPSGRLRVHTTPIGAIEFELESGKAH